MIIYAAHISLTMFVFTSVGAFTNFPSANEIKELFKVVFPTMNENSTIYSLLRNEKDVALLNRIHENICIEMKRKRKIRSLNWLWDMFTLGVDQAIINGTTFVTPVLYTLNSTEEQIFSEEGKCYNPVSPLYTSNLTDPPTTEATGITEWPTDCYGNKVPKKNMRGIDYFNMINNEMDQEKDEFAAGGCPLGFGKG